MIDPRDADRDALWCKAIIATLRIEDVQRVTAEFIRLREVSAQQVAEADNAGRPEQALKEILAIAANPEMDLARTAFSIIEKTARAALGIAT